MENTELDMESSEVQRFFCGGHIVEVGSKSIKVFGHQDIMGDFIDFHTKEPNQSTAKVDQPNHTDKP